MSGWSKAKTLSFEILMTVDWIVAQLLYFDEIFGTFFEPHKTFNCFIKCKRSKAQVIDAENVSLNDRKLCITHSTST